jgi:hypothetical protein
VITSGACFDTACQLADVTKLLPRDLFHAVALRSVAASYAAIER